MKRIATLFLLLISQYAFAQFDKDVFFYRGRQAVQDGKYSAAIENFNILTRLDTTDYWSFFFRGIAKYNLGDIRGAQSDFGKSVQLNPVFTNGYHYKAITLSRFGEYDEALDNFKTAIGLRPGFVGLYFSRGVTYFLAQRFNEAVSDFNLYIKKEPKDPSAYLNRGASYLFLGDTTKAFTDYNRAIRLDRFEPEAYIRRGRLYASQAQYKLAIEDMNRAVELDTSNTFAYFNRALMYYEDKDYNKAMSDLNRVLKDEPGNALTLYNRSLINAQVGNFEDALSDMDRVININPKNVLAYFNRASYLIELGRYNSALEDYNKTIELYPDFAKAYMNRAYVNNLIGNTAASKEDYETANRKVAQYKEASGANKDAFSDTTAKYSALLAFDADFAKKDFDNELLQHRDIDIRLKPLYKFRLGEGESREALKYQYENPLLDRFVASLSVPVSVGNVSDGSFYLKGSSSAWDESSMTRSEVCFLRGLYDLDNKQYSLAMSWFEKAVDAAESDSEKDRYARYYRAFFKMSRGVLRAEMIDFMASIQSNVQTLTMDDKGATRARVGDEVSRSYDYSEAITDMEEAAAIAPDVAYIFFNLGNLYCLSSRMVNSIESYNKAISLYPYMGDAYFNRGLVLVYLKDREKGCIDLSRAGELGVADSYSVISKYCEENEPGR